MTQPSSQNAYDVVAYPSGAFPTTHPQHLATVARLAGMSPPPAEQARVLEIGGGDGINVMAMAVGLPEASFLNIDLAEMPVARGQRIAGTAGLANVRIEVGDILDAMRELEGPFDYIMAHGVYAWVPAAVREGLLALIGRVLSPQGVAFVSYNAQPGGHLRSIIREMMLHEVGHIADPIARIAAAKAFLSDFAQPREGDRAVLAALRDVARPISRKADPALHHDELAEVFEPQAFADVAAAAKAHGLRFLNEAEPALWSAGLPEQDWSEAEVVRAVQSTDYAAACFFHQTLFVRADAAPARQPDYAAIADLFAAVQCERTGPNEFKSDHGTFGISDLPLADAIEKLGQAWPNRLRVGDLVDNVVRLEAIYRLAQAKAIELFSVPLPGVRAAGPHPQASPLVRALIGMGERIVYAVDLQPAALDDAGPRAFLALLDGSRDRAQLAADWAASGYAHEVSVEDALARFAATRMLVE